MAWIESNENLGQHPKTYALMESLSSNLPETIGILHLLWHFALKFSWETGNLKKFSPGVISHAVGWNKNPELLISALHECGWMDNMIIHDWKDFAGKLIQARIYNKQRRITAHDGVKRPHDGVKHPSTYRYQPYSKKGTSDEGKNLLKGILERETVS